MRNVRNVLPTGSDRLQTLVWTYLSGTLEGRVEGGGWGSGCVFFFFFFFLSWEHTCVQKGEVAPQVIVLLRTHPDVCSQFRKLSSQLSHLFSGVQFSFWFEQSKETFFTQNEIKHILNAVNVYKIIVIIVCLFHTNRNHLIVSVGIIRFLQRPFFIAGISSFHCMSLIILMI